MTLHAPHHHHRDPTPVAASKRPCEADAQMWMQQWMPRSVWLAYREGAMRHSREQLGPP